MSASMDKKKPNINLPTYSILNVASLAPNSSPYSIQWSAEGQVLLVTKTSIHILTPDTGIFLDDDSSVSAQPPGLLANDAERSIKWFKTSVELEDISNYNWRDESNAFVTVSLGSMNLSWKEAAWSPSNLTTSAGCLVATLNSNLEVSIWAPEKNHLKGEWHKVHDVTRAIREIAELEIPGEPGNPLPEMQRVLFSQTNCISWSSQAKNGREASDPGTLSLLALGNRAGGVLFFRYDSAGNLMHVKTVSISQGWVTHLAWSEWEPNATGQSEAMLACSLVDGTIVTILVTRKLTSADANPAANTSSLFIFEQQDHPELSELDRRNTTALQWVNTEIGSKILIFSKVGSIHFWNPASASTDDNSITSIILPTLNICSNASSLAFSSGFNYFKHRDLLVLTLADGSFYTIHHLSTKPSLHENEAAEGETIEDTLTPITTDGLSRNARALFETVEGGPSIINRKDMMKTGGVTMYGESGIFMWLHESIRPENFLYRTDAQRKSMIIVKQMWNDAHSGEALLDQIRRCLQNPGHALQHSPTHVLRDTYMHLRRRSVVTELRTELLELLRPEPPELKPADPMDWLADADDIGVDDDIPEDFDSARSKFRAALLAALFQSEAAFRTRLKVSLLLYCSNVLDNKDAELLEMIGVYATQVVQEALLATIDNLKSIVEYLPPESNERTFAHRLVLQALLIWDARSDLLDSTRALAKTLDLSTTVTSYHADQLDPLPALSGYVDLGERCLACNAQIHFTDLSEGRCTNNHYWRRCSVTMRVMASPSVRTCLGCCRKAELPSSQQTESMIDVENWLADEMLEATRSCLYCGNRYVQML